MRDKGFLEQETRHAGPADPQALNRYSHVTNNPLHYTDPSGHMAKADDGMGGYTPPPSPSGPQPCGHTCGTVVAAALDLFVLLHSPGRYLAAKLNGLFSHNVTIDIRAYSATNAELQKTINMMFKDSDRIPGGIAAAVREELRTGRPTRGHYHFVKGGEMINTLTKMLREEELTDIDRAVAKALLEDLKNAFRGK